LEILPKWEEPAIRVLMMPRETNAQGTIFGGVILSYLDQAGAIEARRQGSRNDGAETGRIVREVLREVGSSFPGVHWSLSLAPVPPVMRAPTPVLREVLTIVVRNAAEAMQGRGEVVVEATPQEKHLEILVRDHGPGIAEPDQERIFNFGYTTKAQGHGYGLFLARRLLEAQGGLLRMSAADGGGTLCRIELPLTQTQLAR